MKKLYLLSLVSISLFLTACGQQQDINNTQDNQSNQNQNSNQQLNNQTEKNPQALVNLKQVNQAPEGGANQKVLDAVKKIKDVKECDNLFKNKEDLLSCKRNYIIQNADKLNVKVCDNIKDTNEQKACKSFFKNKRNPQALVNLKQVNQAPEGGANQKVLDAVKKIKDVKECDNLFKNKEDLLACKRNYIIQNADKLNVKVCDNIKDTNEQQACKNFFKNKKK